MKSGLGWTYLIPILFSLLLFGTIIGYADDLANAIVIPLVEYLGLITPDETPAELCDKVTYFLKIAGEYSIYAIVYVASYLIFFKLQKYVVLIAMAPLMAYLSEKAEEKLDGTTYEFKWKLFILDVFRGIRIAIRNLCLELVLLVLVALAVSGLSSLFAPLALISTPLSAALMFIVSAYYYGYSSFDYLNERKRITVSEGNRLIWDNKGLVTGNGSVFSVLVLIPFLGIVLAPMWCPVGAVISAHEGAYHKKATY